jgi:nitrous oxidase accessory protein
LFNASRARVEGNEVTDGRDGIYVSATEDSVFLHNRLERTRYGVHYMYSLRNTLEGNVASNSYSGFALMQSSHIVVRDNVAADNEHDGILFRDAQDCQIVGNRLERNGEGLFFFSSTRNVIADNQVVNNDIGARVWAGSVRNEVTRNVLVGNRQQVFYVGAEDLRWGADRGNYWSDYLGWDQDGDGIGERPYRMDSFSARLIHRFPSASVLLRSPALELLSQLERTVPILRVPTIIDERPLVSGKR